MRKLGAALVLVVLLAPALIAVLEDAPAPQAAPRAEARLTPKVVRGPQLTHPDPLVWPTPPFVSIPDADLLRPRTRDAIGTARIVVILAEFTDVTHLASKTMSFFDNQINGQSGATMRAYYAEASYNQLTIQATVVNWVNTGHTMAYYGTDSASGTDDGNGPVYRLVVDAVLAANAAVNFAQFDQDGPSGVPDGVIDHLFLIHAGDAQESSNDPADTANRIWSHRWAVADGDLGAPGDQPLMVDGVEAYGYIMASETSPIGVFAHEFGHDLGLPDLYDIDGSSKGVGAWDIMATGSWNGLPRGSSPAHFSSWAKAKLGWLLPDEVTDARYAFALQGLVSAPAALKLPVRAGGGPAEYFLVEYRRRAGFDAELPGEGLLVWHVDDALTDNADDAHRLLDLEEADEALATNKDNPEDPADAWADSPTGFGPDTVPNSNGYGNLPTGWKVRAIGTAGGAAITFDVSKDVDDDLALVDLEKPSGVSVNTEVEVTATVSNNGARTQTAVPVTLTTYLNTFNASARVGTDTVSIPSIARGQNVTVSWRFTPDRLGNYILRAEVVLAADEIPENNDRISHVGAYTFLMPANDVEGSQVGWDASPSNGDFRWQVVAPGDAAHDAFSPTRAWRFGWYGGGTSINGTIYLTSPVISLSSPAAYLSFQHKYALSGLIVENSTSPPETDEAFVEIQVNGGAWQPLLGPTGAALRWNGTHLDWSKVYANLTANGAGAGTVRLRWGATGQAQAREGGWWLDDLFVVAQNLTYGMAVRAARTYEFIEPGGQTTYRLKVINVGDFPDTYAFRSDLPPRWDAWIRLNVTDITNVTAFRLTLDTDHETAVLLVVQAPLNIIRGTIASLAVEAVSAGDARQTNNLRLTAEVYDPVGIGKFLRYLPLFFLLLIVLAAIVAVIRKIKSPH